MRIQYQTQSSALLHRGSQKSIDLRADVALPFTSVLQVALPKVLGQQQCVFGRRANDISRWPKEGADRDRKKTIRFWRPIYEKPFFLTDLQECFAVESAKLSYLQLPRQFVVSEIRFGSTAGKHAYNLRLEVDLVPQFLQRPMTIDYAQSAHDRSKLLVIV